MWNDYDLEACLEYNGYETYVSAITEILAVTEGINDEKDWHWIVKLNPSLSLGGNYAFITGGCDYTGWDCQSWATLEEADTLKEALYIAENLMIAENMRYTDYSEDYKSLVEQVNSGKNKTWREQTEDKLNIKETYLNLGDLP